MSDYIFDRFRQRYEIEIHEDSDQAYYIKIKDREEYVGQLLCSFHDESVMILEDLFIRNDQDTPDDWGVDRKLRPAAPIFEDGQISSSKFGDGRHSNKVKMNYRNRGLGSALLRLMVDLAKRRGMKTVFGSIVRKDILRNPHLIRWYLNRGFNLTTQFQGCIPEAETYIHFEIPYE
jgi:GNAT superfamily N-acetyltransferase